MTQSYRILLVEDNQDDVELLRLQLKKLDLKFKLDVVDQKKEFIEHLENQLPDVIISDYNLPGFTGMEALDLVRENNVELPFILISGFIGEEKAVDAMLKGASDYVLKDNLERLVPAVKREIIHFREQKEAEKERDIAIRDLNERVKEQKCLYNISSLDDHNLTISELLQKAVEYLPEGFQYPEIAEASIEYDGEIYQTGIFVKTGQSISKSIDDIEKGPLVLTVAYLKSPQKLKGSSFLDEEDYLLTSILKNLSLKINRIQNQKELEEKRELLERVYDLAQMGNWEIDLVKSKIYWSPTTKKIHEVPEDFIPDMETGINFYKEGEDRETIRRVVNRAIDHGESCDVELRIITAKGNEKWIRVIGEPEFQDGKCIRIFGSIQDIDERKRAEEEVYKREQRFRSMVQDGTDLIAIIDADGKYKYVAPTKHRIQKMGREAKEFYGKTIYDVVHPNYHDLLRESIRSISRGENVQVKPFKYRSKVGEWRWMESTITNLTENSAVNGYVTNSRDVTDRIEQERKLRDIVENSTNLFYRHDTNHVITYISPQSQEFLGCSPEVAKKRWTEFVTDHPINEEGYKKTIKAMESGVAQKPYELQLQKVNGDKIWVEVNEAPVVENGKTIAMVGSLTDITARKEYAEKLEELSLVASKTTDVIIMTDADEHITWVNDAYEKLTGYTLEESLGKIPGDFLQGPETDPETVKRLAIAIDNKQSVQETILNYAKDGTKYWLDIKIDPIYENGECTGFIAIERDVTDKREAFDKLVSTEQKLREIVEHSTNLFFRHDVNHQLQYVSPQSYDFVGLKPEEAMKKWTDLVTDHPKNEIGFKKTKKAIETGEPQGPYELQFKHTDGSTVWARVHEAPVVENGETVAIVGSLTDITEEKKYEEKLEELSQIAAKTTDLIFVADNDHRITWVNTAFEESTGYTLKESKGSLPSELFFKSETNKGILSRINKKMDKKETVQETIQIETKFGVEKWVDITIDSIAVEDENSTQFFTIMKDVTEKIEKERALQESLERYDIVTKATSDVIWDADFEDDTVAYNSNIYYVFGYDEDEIIHDGAWWLSNIHPDDRERVDREFKMAELANKDRVQSEYRFRCADGSYKYVNDRAYILNDEHGNPVRMIGAMQDITKQKEENIWLKLLESAITNTNESIAILDGETKKSAGREILFVNEAFQDMTGYKKEEVLGQSLLDFMSDQTDSNAVKRVLQLLAKGEACQIESAYQSKKGEQKWAHISFAPVLNSNNEFSHWICIGRDITEQRERERELRESLQEKETLLMEIHHRVKNNLAVVSSMMQLQAMEEADESLQRKLYDSVSRIRTMVTIHEMLYESGSFSKIDFSINLKKLVSMITETIHNQKKIDVEFNCDEVELNVNQAIPSSLIVNEVVTNSLKHAFKERSDGKITIELREISNTVKIQVKDNGVGLPGHFKNIGDSSLGLQLISVLSKQMNADYKFESSSEEGTVFTIQFGKSAIRGIGNAYLSE